MQPHIKLVIVICMHLCPSQYKDCSKHRQQQARYKGGALTEIARPRHAISHAKSNCCRIICGYLRVQACSYDSCGIGTMSPILTVSITSGMQRCKDTRS